MCILHLKMLFSCSVMSNSLWPHGLQHTRLPCPSLSPGTCSNSYPLGQWCHPTISPSVIPFSFCLQSFPASGSFLMSQLFASGGQSIGASVSVVTLASEYSGLISFRINWFDLLEVQETLKSLLQHHTQKHQFFGTPPSLVQLSHLYMATGKTISLTIWTFVSKAMFLLFNTLSRFVNNFSSMEQASFNFMAAVTICVDFGAQENKVCHCFHCFPIC